MWCRLGFAFILFLPGQYSQGQTKCDAGQIAKARQELLDAVLTDPTKKRKELNIWSSPLSESQTLDTELKPISGRSIANVAVEDELRSGRIVKSVLVGKGSNHPQKVYFENGKMGIWKPHTEDAQSNYRAEVLAYELDQKFGFGLVPVTVERTIDGEVGSLQLFIKNAKETQKGSIVPKAQDSNKQSLFDYLIENRDRGPSNELLGADGRLHSIDNGMSFTGFGYNWQDYSRREKDIRSFFKTAEAEAILNRIKQAVQDPKYRLEVKDYLGSSDAEQLMMRMKFIIQEYDKFKGI